VSCSRCRIFSAGVATNALAFTALVAGPAMAAVPLVLGVRHLPVTSRDGQLIGMVSMRDLLAAEAWA
jgi:CBS domain-containing protein